MGSKKSRKRHNRRDRRKAKASGYRREGTTNPRKKGHHAYDARDSGPARKSAPKTKEPVIESPFAVECQKCGYLMVLPQCPLCGWSE